MFFSIEIQILILPFCIHGFFCKEKWRRNITEYIEEEKNVVKNSVKHWISEWLAST